MDDIDDIGKFGLSLDECENRDAYASVWKDMVANNEFWGGRAHGEKARLNIAASCMDSVQLLILDEPTNHLSLEAIEGLAVACREFKGGLLFASHNRYFINLVADQILHIENGIATLTHVRI